MPITFDTPVQYLTGVGEARAAGLAKLGITTVGQLLYHFPRGYEFRGNVQAVATVPSGETASFILVAATDVSNTMLRRGMVISRLRAFDESGSCEITFFNQPYIKDSIHKGCEYRFYGKLIVEGSKRLLNSPVVEPIEENKPLPNLVAVYPLTAGITQKLLAKLVKNALDQLIAQPGAIPELLPDKVRAENNLCAISYALTAIHFPPDFDTLSIAKRRLIFEEFYRFALGAAGRGEDTRRAPMLADTDTAPLIAPLPYTLTGAQTRAIADIAADLSSGKPMRRLVSGDVGSGKTIVAAAAAYMTAKNGFQCALMAPTEILATQHYNDLAPLFEKLGIGCRLLTGSIKAAERKKLLPALADGSVGVIIGTHALITEDVRFHALGLVICDEQHRFGVGQREALLAKASDDPSVTCHQLTMSATPIPRTLAMFLYGDLAMSPLDEMPPGRQRVETFVVNEGYRERLNAFIEKQCAVGNQVYVVCPSVEEIEGGEVTMEDIRLFDFGYDAEELMRPQSKPKAAVTWASTLAEALPGRRVGCVHGKMKAADKDAVMRSFAAGELDVLVSTTVIEVGVNVPNATLMIVENAERFGLSQLHQLRGRVGRGAAKSCCVLVSDAKSGSTARQRLDVMRTTYDGFKIAEFDLSERGPGDFIPRGEADGDVRQHGELRFRLANLCEDMKLLESAVNAAKEAAKQP
ncbi:MAG: ATP-dependent DNA helicase RecG [Clostridia bacterium]|nr:ATP-dependent DNA helicase RecG [Clostridia bacterium]